LIKATSTPSSTAYIRKDAPDSETNGGTSAQIAAICGIWAGVNIFHNHTGDILCSIAREGASRSIAGVDGMRRHEADGELAALRFRQASKLPNRLHFRRLAGSYSGRSYY
jgi:hypothetical protein